MTSEAERKQALLDAIKRCPILGHAVCEVDGIKIPVIQLPGKMPDDLVERIAAFVDDQLSGEDFHKILVIDTRQDLGEL